MTFDQDTQDLNDDQDFNGEVRASFIIDQDAQDCQDLKRE
jgi:hypothetical protein